MKLRGDIKQKQRNFHGALMDYTKAERIEPDNPRLYVSRSAIHITEGHLREAVADCDRAIKLDPNDADAWYNRACADYMGRNNDGAMRSLERAVKLKSEHADALFLAVQGNRLGSRLYADLFAFAREHGIPRITCEFNVVPPNEPSRRFHERHGFVETGRQWLDEGRKQVSMQVVELA